VGDLESFQERAERREVEADAVHGPLDRFPNAQRRLRLGFEDRRAP
jgi:hypothetical protein